MPDSDGEGQGRLRFKSFKASDMENPTFKVGMVFESVELLRKAIIEYSIKQRVEIKLPRNKKKRLKAHCADGCDWNLYASSDTRTQGLMVKTYCGQHSCQKKWAVKKCTSRWLAEKYVESFRADQKMTLTNFQRIVQKELNLTVRRTTLARAKRLAMKVIPPVYEKKVGRPPKNRRKQPHEVDSKFGKKMSKHGTMITCSYYGIQGHNRGGCELRKAGITPNFDVLEDPIEQVNPEHAFDDLIEDVKQSQVSMKVDQESQPPLSQMTQTIVFQLDREFRARSIRKLKEEALPDSSFIMSNIPTSRPVAPTTATKQGRATLKRKATKEGSKIQVKTKEVPANTKEELKSKRVPKPSKKKS